jgi:hypothetical protein
MKQLKPFMFLATGFALAFLFSFKNDAPVKEYASISLVPTMIKVNYGKEVVKEFKTKSDNQDNDMVTIINDMAKDGWVVIDNDHPKGDFSYQRVTLERIRK